jgi:hypothetical protein
VCYIVYSRDACQDLWCACQTQSAQNQNE